MLAKLGQCTLWSRLIALGLSVVWLLFLHQFLQLRPDIPSRQYLKSQQQGPKNYGIVRLSTLDALLHNSTQQAQELNLESHLHFFNLFYVSPPNRVHCQRPLLLLILNANAKQPGESYLSLYHQIDKENPYCQYTIYELTRKHHLLMNSQPIMEIYAWEFIHTLQFIMKSAPGALVSVLTFEQGCGVLAKALELVPLELLAGINTMVMINSHNPNVKIMYQPQSTFMKEVMNNLINDAPRLRALNQTKMVFISTVTRWDPFIHETGEEAFNFVWEGARLRRSFFVSTRFMVTVGTLLHERDYFSYGNFLKRLAEFIVQDGLKIMNRKQIQYFFLYGNVYARPLESAAMETNCLRLMQRKQTTSIKSKNDCWYFGQDLIITSPIFVLVTDKHPLTNSRMESILPTYRTATHLYYIFEQLKKGTLIYIHDSQFRLKRIQVFSPHGRTLRPSFYETVMNNVHSPALSQRDHLEKYLLRVCPDQQLMIFPEQFAYYSYDKTEKYSILFYSLYRFTLGCMLFNPELKFHHDCYPDFLAWANVLPPMYYSHWALQRNILILVLLLFHLCEREPILKTNIYYCIVLALNYLHSGDTPILYSFVLLAAGVLLDKVVALAGVVADFAQEIVPASYKKFMLAFVVCFSVMRETGAMCEQLQFLSTWKLLFISLIFVVNRKFILVLVLKLYFLWEHIIYNHVNQLELIVVLLWLYMGINQKRYNQTLLQLIKDRKITSSEELYTKYIQLNGRNVGGLEKILTLVLCVLVAGPSYLINVALSVYVVLKFMTNSVLEREPV